MSLRTFFVRVICVFESMDSRWLFFVIILGTIRWHNPAQSVSDRPAQEPEPGLGTEIWKLKHPESCGTRIESGGKLIKSSRSEMKQC